MVNHHRLVVTFVRELHLLHEAVVLVYWVVELRIGVRQLFAVYHELETLGQTGFASVHLSQRRHLYGVIGDERRLDESALAGLAENLVNQLAFAHVFGVLYAEFLCLYAYLVLAHRSQVQTGLFFDGIQNRQTAVRRFEIYLMVAYLHFRCAVHGYRNLLQQLLRETHHPVVVFVLNVQLHAGELRVVAAVHTFVAEVTAYLIHALETAHDESFQIQLSRDTQIHIYVQRVMMGDERTGTRATGYLLQDRCLHLRVTRLVEYLTHRADDGRTLEESVLHALVNDEIDITLTVT